jgi:hypothetical protein
MHAAGWFPADPITLRSSIEIVGSVVLDRPFHDAPVSPLYYDGKKQQLAYEKPDGRARTGGTTSGFGWSSKKEPMAVRSRSNR